MASKRKTTLETFKWGITLALKIDRRALLLWLGVSVILAVLPAVALQYNRQIIAGLSDFLLTGADAHAQVMAGIIFYGVLLTIIGLSTRFNDDMLYMMMYDAYYLGLEEVMMDSAQKVPLRALMEKKTGDDYFAAISRCGALTDLTSSGCVLLSKFVSILSLLYVAATSFWPAALFALAYLALVLWLNARYAKRTQVVWSALRDDMRRADYLEKLVREPDPAKEVRLYDSLGQTIAKWKTAYQKVEATQTRQDTGIAALSVWLRTGFYVFLFLVMMAVVWNVGNGAATPALALMLFTLCISLSEAIAAIPKSYQRVAYGLYGLGIQKEFFERAPQIEQALLEPSKGENTEQAVFEARDMSFAYQNGKDVLRDITFQIKKGESIALVGHNGSGKTTLIKLLLGLYTPTAGTLTYCGQTYTPERSQALSEKVGSFFQDFYLFHLTVGENVGAGDVKNIENRPLIEAAVRAGGAEQIVEKLPKKLDNLLGVQVYRSGAVLSGGERQRVAVSRAFMSDKEVLVFDEPASMLDPIAELNQFESIQKKVSSHTSILVSHRIGFARLADRIFVMDGGKLAEVGTHEELLARKGAYHRLFMEQAQWYGEKEAEQ